MQPVTGHGAPLAKGAELGQHAGREVLVSSSPDPNVIAPASSWQWCVIREVQPHPDGAAWRRLITNRGDRTVTAAVTYSVRDPRPEPSAASDG